MDDEADLQKMIEVLNSNKQTEWDDFNFGELQDTTDSEDSDLENEPDTSEMVDDELYDIEANDVVSVYKHDPISSLKPEEKDLIDHCDDPELKQVLFLNRKKNINLILLYKKLQDLLMECRQYIIEKASLLREHINTLKANNLSSASWKLAAPYFKDKDLYQSPMNDDTKIKMNNHELFIYDFKPNKPWTNFEYEKLIKAVKLNYSFKKHQLKKAVKRENDKQPAGQSCGDTAVEEHVENFETEIPPLNSNDHLDWSRIASVFLQDKHKEFECRSTWHLLLHPSINNSPWTPEESDRLKHIAEKYRFQNWKAIALELATNRSEFIVCKHFSSNLSEKFKKGEFNYEEDKKLLELVKRYKIGNFIQWNKITSHFRNRTRAQIYHRYCYFLSQDSKKKGKFTKAEDIVLMIYVDKFGRKFANIVKYLPNRSMIQCKSRYANNLERTNQKGNWTLEEDEKVCEHVKNYGSQSWSKLSKELNRSRGQLRQRYIRLKAFMDADPDADLAKLPRSRRILADSDRYAFCRTIADKYRGVWKIPTVEEIEKKIEDESVDIEVSSCDDYDPNDDEVFLKTPISDEVRQNLRETKETDESLLEFFSNSFKSLPTERISEPELEQGIDDIEGVLTALKANLTIPDDFETTHKDYLDPLDCRILRCLKERKICAPKTTSAAQKLKSIRELIPPSFYSTIGMRSLLIKHLKLECRSKDIYELSSKGRGSFSSIRQNIANDIMACSTKDRKELENERNLFYRRFHSLFKWPALMTLENPSTEILNISDFLPVKKVSTVKRTYSRTAPDVNQQQDVGSQVKRSKSSSSGSSNVSVNVIKLRPVANESVIKDLMKNKKKKLFSVNKINENGCVKTVISEIKLDFETTKLNFDNAVVLGKNVAASRSVVSAVEQAGVSIEDNRWESTSSSASSSTSSAIKDLPLVVIKSDIDGNSEILGSGVNLENSSEASTSKHLPIVSKKTRSSSKAIKDLPLVVIKGNFDGNSQMLELSSRGQFRNSFDTCNRVVMDTKDSVSMEMLPKESNRESSDQFNATEDANTSRDNEDEDKRDVEKLNMFLREYSEDSDGDSDIDISDFNSDHDSDIDISDFNVMV